MGDHLDGTFLSLSSMLSCSAMIQHARAQDTAIRRLYLATWVLEMNLVISCLRSAHLTIHCTPLPGDHVKLIIKPRVGMSSIAAGNTVATSIMALVKGDDESATVAAIWSLYVLVKGYPILLLLLVVVLRFFFRRHYSPLRLLPGPFLASGSRVWKGISDVFTGKPWVTDVLTTRSVWSTYQGHTEQDHIELHRKYGILGI